MALAREAGATGTYRGYTTPKTTPKTTTKNTIYKTIVQPFNPKTTTTPKTTTKDNSYIYQKVIEPFQPKVAAKKDWSPPKFNSTFSAPVPTLSSQLGASDNTTVKPNTEPGTKSIQYGSITDSFPENYMPEVAPTEEFDYVDYFTNLVKDKFRYDSTADINAIKQAYEQGIVNARGQIPGVQQNARAAYDANDAGYNQSLGELRAAMEQAGLYRGGDMAGRNIDLLTMRGQNRGIIGQEEMNQLNSIQQAIAQMENEKGLKIAEVEAANNAAEAQALIDAANSGIQNQFSLAGLTGNINGTDTLAKIQQDYNQTMGITDRTGIMPDGNSTMQYQQMIADNAYRQQQFEESVRQFNANYGLDLRQMTLQEAQQKLDEKYRSGQLSLQQKNQALSEAEFAYRKQQDFRDYSLSMQQLQQQQQPQQLNANDYKTDPDFAKNVAYINANPANALSEIIANSEALIASYGWDGYNELLKLARGY